MRRIPEHEVRVDYARSSGPGGQNVNKRETKAVLHWPVGPSSAFSDEEKGMIRSALSNRLNADDEIVVSAENERSREQNRRLALNRLDLMVVSAVTPRAPRKPTKVPRAQKRERLGDKRRVSEKKRLRRPGRNED